MKKGIDAVFFISFGGPEKPEDIRPFLENVTRGRPIPPARIEEVARHYEAMGGSSPINAITERQAEALRRELAGTDTPWPVYVGNRNWHPFIEDALKKMVTDGVRRAVGFCTAAQRSEASLERYIEAVEAARRKIGAAAPEIDYVGPWFDHPLLISAVAARATETLAAVPEAARKDLSLVFTAHSIPCPMAKDSTYVLELQTTAGLAAQQLGFPSWRLAYSSRSGNPRDPWLEPDISDEIRAQAGRGVRHMLVVPIGFIADHVEVLFDLDIQAKASAVAAGVTLYRAPTIGDHPHFIRMIAEVARERQSQDEKPEMTSSKATRFRDGRQAACPGKASRLCYCRPDAIDPPCLKTA